MPDLLTSLFFLGRPFSPLYGLCMRMRSVLYHKGIFRRQKMQVPVISIGNLTMGGTGKTPVVRFIADLLQKNGYQPAIISRGYGGKVRDRVNVVSDGKTIQLDAEHAGDEPVLLAESLSGIPVITGSVRVHPCLFAIENLGCNVLILDDGFQHLPVERDLDLVLFNAAAPLGNNKVIPGGHLREPFSSLARADAFLITNMREEFRKSVDKFQDDLNEYFPQTPVFVSRYEPKNCTKVDSSELLSFPDIPLDIYGLCGIANPLRFRTTLLDCGFRITGFTEMQDHQVYSQQLIEQISNLAENSGARAIITTEKDMVKIRSYVSSLPIYYIAMSVKVNDGFSDFILTTLAKFKK